MPGAITFREYKWLWKIPEKEWDLQVIEGIFRDFGWVVGLFLQLKEMKWKP